MPLTADDLQARIDTLQTARDAGVLMVRHGDTSTQFRSLNEMNMLLAQLKRELANLTGTSKSRVNYIGQRTKGYSRRPRCEDDDGFWQS